MLYLSSPLLNWHPFTSQEFNLTLVKQITLLSWSQVQEKKKEIFFIVWTSTELQIRDPDVVIQL